MPRGPSLFIAYLFWLCSGFMGLHRFYLRSVWGFAFIPVFLRHPARQRHDPRSPRRRVAHACRLRSDAQIEARRATLPPGVATTPAMTERLQKAQADEAKAKADADVEVKANWTAGRAIRAGSRS